MYASGFRDKFNFDPVVEIRAREVFTISDESGKSGLMLVYSVDQPESFAFIPDIMESLKKRQRKRKIIFITVANKVDLEDQRAVAKEDGLNLSENFRGSLYMRTSGRV